MERREFSLPRRGSKMCYSPDMVSRHRDVYVGILSLWHFGDDNDIQDTVNGLNRLLFTNFEVVDVIPAVTNVNPSHAGAGTSV
jgi:hypothetical protein